MTTIKLRRNNTAIQWGFRLNGGVDLPLPLHIQKVTPNGLAHRAGLQPGDGVIQIGQLSSVEMTHEEAKMAIIRSGNELEFAVNRNAVPVSSPIIDVPSPDQLSPVQNDRDPDFWRRQTTPLQDPNLQSRSFKLLQQSFCLK